MAMRRGPRLQVGSAAWIAEERNSALNIARSEIEEFSFSVRNEVDWLNEHMAEIFSENQMNVAELFKTPGKLRGKTPRTVRKAITGSVRVPLSDVFSATVNGAPAVFSSPNLSRPRTPQFQVAEDKPEPPVSRPDSPPKPAVILPPQPVEPRAPNSLADSGYHGSQSQDTLPFDHFDKFDKDIEMSDSPQRSLGATDPDFPVPAAPATQSSPSVVPAEAASRSANEGETRQATASATANAAPGSSSAIPQPASSPFAARTRLPVMSPRSPPPKKMTSPVRHSPANSSSQKLPSPSPQKGFPKPTEALNDASNSQRDNTNDAAGLDDVRSPSDASSPIRPIVRKSSINFASLPAREPLPSKKSVGGARMSRTSHLDFSRQSYYSRHTGGKSIGNVARPTPSDDDDEMDVDNDATVSKEAPAEHTKTFTQLLQDQISMLGKAQSTGPRPSKSIANLVASRQSVSAAHRQSQIEPPSDTKILASPNPTSPKTRTKQSVAAPGAYPSDDEDDWIVSPTKAAGSSSPRTQPSKGHSADASEGPAGKVAVGPPQEFVFPKGRLDSPGKIPFSPGRTPGTPSHIKSASVPSFPTMDQLSSEPDDVALKTTISVSNPTLSAVAEDGFAASPPRSPTRGFRDNPLKQVKNKLSSLLKSSKGLIASSAAISAEGKSSLLQSPSTSRLGYHPEPSVESFKTADNVVYPDLSQQVSATSVPLSPTRSNSTRRTRASAERERREAKEREKEEKEKEKEIREAKRMAEQLDKLEKLREQEREKARVFNKEQEKIAAMERQVAAQKEQEKAVQAQGQRQVQDFRTPGPPPKAIPKSSPKSSKATPRKMRGQGEEDGKNTAALSDELDLEMPDATSTVPPASIPRPTTASSIRAQGKRPVKPTKEPLAKSKQAPTVIWVNTTSSQQSQLLPSNNVLSATLQETLGQQPASAQRPPLNRKASHPALQTKHSIQSLKSSVSSTGRPKALELAAKRKEQEEREAQRKREAKRELERKRAAQEEERRAERLREEERKAGQAKKAAIEKAKQTKAPPPAVRSQPNGPPDYAIADKAPLRPPSRLGSTIPQDSRLVNMTLSNAAKASAKRPLQPDAHEESSRSQQQRALPSLPGQDGKRMRISEDFDADIDMMDSQQIIKPPVQPSGALKKDLPTKPMYGNGYADPPPSGSRSLYKATVTAQHQSQVRTAHPLEMAHLSKAPIPFAPNPTVAGHPHKTPARPAGGTVPRSAKSVARSSPGLHGESIELPDIETDQDSDDDDAHVNIAAWADSPALKAALLAQERVDPMQVFGPPAPLNMEEVFNKSKDRWPKFRARTSSANWSGTDRLTEEDIRKDKLARDKMRREGGWTYELTREMS